MDQKKEFYVGIDIGRDRAMISLYREDQKEPETISTVRGMEKFGIPLVMFLEKKGTTYYGDEALKRKEQPNGDFLKIFTKAHCRSRRKRPHCIMDCLCSLYGV